MSKIKELSDKLSRLNIDLLMIRLDTKGDKLERLKAASALIETAADILRKVEEE